MHDRNSIKWAPFNSVINGNYVLNSIIKEKSKINKPILSSEQIENYENLIKESQINKINLLFSIYSNGFIKEIKGTVFKIEVPSKRIILTNHISIYFCEIVKIKLLNY